jgi:hypothetical protein
VGTHGDGWAGVVLGVVVEPGRWMMKWFRWLFLEDTTPLDPYPEITQLSGIQVVHYIRELKRKGRL